MDHVTIFHFVQIPHHPWVQSLGFGQGSRVEGIMSRVEGKNVEGLKKISDDRQT